VLLKIDDIGGFDVFWEEDFYFDVFV